jgi:cytochrome c oxidase subunit 4
MSDTTDLNPAAPAIVAPGGDVEDIRYQLTHPAPGLLPGEVKPHPAPIQYVMVAVVLSVITGLEISVSYMDGDIPRGLIVTLLLVMGLTKFVLVALWFMHLRTDQKVFKRLFLVGGTGALLLYLIVLTSLHVFNQ